MELFQNHLYTIHPTPEDSNTFPKPLHVTATDNKVGCNNWANSTPQPRGNWKWEVPANFLGVSPRRMS